MVKLTGHEAALDVKDLGAVVGLVDSILNELVRLAHDLRGCAQVGAVWVPSRSCFGQPLFHM